MTRFLRKGTLPLHLRRERGLWPGLSHFYARVSRKRPNNNEACSLEGIDSEKASGHFNYTEPRLRGETFSWGLQSRLKQRCFQGSG